MSTREASRGQSGAVNIVTLLLLATLVAVSYGGYVYIPLAINHIEIRQACIESLNSTWRHRDSERTQADFLRRARAIAVEERLIGGDLRRVAAIDPRDSMEVIVDERTQPPTMSISLSYEREIVLPWLDRTHVFFFSSQCERELR